MMRSCCLLAAALLSAAEEQQSCQAGDASCQQDGEVSAMMQLHKVGAEKKPPHVLFILADDYGWGSFGPHRLDPQTPEEKQAAAETHTPNLDKLVEKGILLERHYAYKICSPSRSSLQSGRLAVHVNTVNTGVTFWEPENNVSGFAGIPRNMTGMAELMKKGGYRTHMVGKWDAGMATPEHTPLGRGYDSWMGYFQHANDYWDEGMPFSSTGDIDSCQNRFVDHSLYNKTYRGGVTTEIRRELGCDARNPHVENITITPQQNATGCSKDKSKPWCLPESCYEEAMFNSYALKVIEEHNPRKPLFLFYAFHLIHTPLQITQSALDKLDRKLKEKGARPIETQNRRLYAAMVMYMDEMVGKVVAKLKEKNMYKDTLIVFTADNGGPVYEPGSANNYPLKGGKYSDWEGGVRTNAFVSGGYVPKERRGQNFTGVISIADWYATLADIAGVEYEDKKAAEANPYLLNQGYQPLHPVDGRPQWEHIVNNTNGREDPLHLSSQAVLEYPYKLVTGKQEFTFYQGPLYPNCSTVRNIANGPLASDLGLFGQSIKLSANATEQAELTYTYDCSGGCLFNVEEDPTESTDLSKDPRYAAKLYQMQRTLYRLNFRNFDPFRGYPALEACVRGAYNGGFYGPFVDVEDFYKGNELTPAERIVAFKNAKELAIFNRTLMKIPNLLVQAFVDNFGVIGFANAVGINNTLDVCYATKPWTPGWRPKSDLSDWLSGKAIGKA